MARVRAYSHERAMRAVGRICSGCFRQAWGDPCRRCARFERQMQEWDIEMLGTIPFLIAQPKRLLQQQIEALPPDLRSVARQADKLYERAVKLNDASI